VIHRLNTMARQQQRGFTLVELMISLVLGLLLILGVISVYVTNQQAARTNEGLARLQEGGRIAFELMSRELRQAGGNACGAPLVANVLNNPDTAWFTDFAAGPVRGFDGDVDVPAIVPTGAAVGQRVANTDAVVVMGPSPNDNAVIVAHNPPAAQFALNTIDHGIAVGEVVMVCDQQSAAITQITNSSPGTNATIVHNTGTASPGNCTVGLGFPVLCTANGTPKNFAAGGIVARLSPGFWYIGNNPRGGRSLYRASATAQEEITDGVTDMQLRYLTRESGSGNLDTDWVDATDITDWSDDADDVPVAMRIELTLASLQSVGTDQQPLRRVQVHAVTLRNRAL
jgi:type IV pilus assembly protein PilW